MILRSMALLAYVARLWQMLKGPERLLGLPYGLAVGRAREGLLPCLPAVRRGLVHTSSRRAWWARRSRPARSPRSAASASRASTYARTAPPPLLEESATGTSWVRAWLEGVDLLGNRLTS